MPTLNNIYGLHYLFQAQAQAPGQNGHPHSIFAVAVPLLINIVAIKFQSQKQSPFETHPKTSYSGILTMLLYFAAFDYQQRLGMRLHRPLALAGFIHRCVLFLGYMAMAILASLIFPDSASRAVYAIYIAISGGDMVVLVCRKMGGWLRKMMIEAEQGNDNQLPV